MNASLNAATFLAQLQQRAEVPFRRDERRQNERFFEGLNRTRLGQVRRVVQFNTSPLVVRIR